MADTLAKNNASKAGVAVKALRAARRVGKKFAKSDASRGRYFYTSCFIQNPPIDSCLALFETFNGKSFGGNPFYILKAMCEDSGYDSIKKVVAVNMNALEKTRVLIEAHGFRGVSIVTIHSKEYARVLVTAKYLCNNSTFNTYFIKRPGQLYLNTWHGTPLKTMGRRISNQPWSIGNTQRNLLMADYQLYPNRHTFDVFLRDYMLSKYYENNYVLGGYPCNAVFYDEGLRSRVRDELGLEGKKVVVYMPTWRSAPSGPSRQKHSRMSDFILMNLEDRLSDDVVLFAKPHYYSRGVTLEGWKHVRTFPSELETYELLCAADVLVTDYSSVMFDFLNANKPIILLDYDRDEYFQTRGSYLDLDEFPFQRTKDSYELAELINAVQPDSFGGYVELKERFAPFDSAHAAKEACHLLLDGDFSGYEVIEGSAYHNDKKNVLIFAGALQMNGITTSLEGLLEQIDPNRANILLTFQAGAGKKRSDFISRLPEDIDYLPIQGPIDISFDEIVPKARYFRFDETGERTREVISRLYAREAMRCFCGIHFDVAIHFTGYEKKLIHVIAGLDCDRRIIYVHNDIKREHEVRGNVHLPSLERAYREFDKVVTVRESQNPLMHEDFGVPYEKITTVHNTIKVNVIRSRSHEPLCFDPTTVSNATPEQIDALLKDSGTEKFINVCRFSPEKGIPRLVDAFDRYVAESDRKESCLFIIGGHGIQYGEVMERVARSAGNVIVIRGLSNPFPVIRRCDCFIMSSFYEGLPMAIMEALVLGLPVISTNIDGPRQFLEQGYGLLVDNSTEGLIDGFRAYGEGRLASLKPFDADEFNEVALSEFYKVVGI